MRNKFWAGSVIFSSILTSAIIFYQFRARILEQSATVIASDVLPERKLFCRAGHQYKVPPELVAGVFLAENVLNRGWKDRAQDAIFQFLVDNRDEKWWSQWADEAMAMADRDEEIRLMSNKWPVELVSTGIVFSIGPAQITPRTALTACLQAQPRPSICEGGVRSLVKRLLSQAGSIEIAALVLQYEYLQHFEVTGKEISCNLGAWSTLYNYGGAYYRKASLSQATLVNRFSQWVESHSKSIRIQLACEISGCLTPVGVADK
jgi:hypothetical protein